MVKLHSSPWFSAACAAALFHWIHFFCLHQQNKSSEPRVKFKYVSNHCKNLHMLLKQESLSLHRKTAIWTLDELLIVFSTNLITIFPSRTNLKLHISVAPKVVKKIITNLDLSKASGPDCISVVVLKNCEPELSNILVELFNISLVVFVFKNVGERSTAKNYCTVSLLSVVSKVL